MTIGQVCENYYIVVHNSRIIHGYTYDHDKVDDITQIVFLKVIRFWTPEHETWNEKQIIGWLKSIIMTTILDTVRADKTREPRSCELLDTYIAPGRFEEDIERRELLKVALSRLPKGQRATLLLAVQGYRTREIEAREHSTPEAVKGRLHRARKSLATFKREWEQVAA